MVKISILNNYWIPFHKLYSSSNKRSNIVVHLAELQHKVLKDYSGIRVLITAIFDAS